MRSRWLILAVLFLARASLAFQFQSIAAVSQFLIADLKLDYAQLGFLVGIYMLPGVVISLPGGVLGARFGDKSVTLCGLLLMVIGGVMTGLADQYAMALAGRLVSGIGAVLLNVLLTKMTSDWFAGREIIVAMAILVTSFPFGIGVALAVEPALAAAQSWPAAIHATAVGALLALLLVAVFYRTPQANPAPPSVRLLGGMTSREFMGVSLAGMIWALYNVSYILLVTFSPTLLIARGLSAADAGFATSFATWTLIVSVPLGGALIERSGRPVLLIAICLILMAAALAGVGVSGDSRWAIALTGLIGGVPAGAIMALPAQVLSPQSRSAGMGVFFTWYYLAMALFPAIAGLLRDLSGDPRVPLLFAAGIGVVTVGVVYAFASLMRASASPGAAR
jgi:MFS family permease